MRPYNTYRNLELSQPVSSVENTLTDKTSNASFDLLRSLSESISVDCGSFEVSAPTEYYQSSSAPSRTEFVDPGEKEIRTPVESAPAAPVKRESAKTPVKSSASVASDMDDDDYDCMKDPSYRAQGEKAPDSPSFEELMARTAEGIAKMREETREFYSTSEKDDLQEKCRVAEPSTSSRPQPKSECVENAPKPESKPSIDSHSESSAKKRFLSSISWDKTKKLLFSRETIKLAFLSIAVSALIVSAAIYKNSARRNNGLPESDDVVMNQSASEIQNVPAQENVVNSNASEFNDSVTDNYWNPQGNDWASSDNRNPRGLTDQMRDDYQSPTFDSDSSGYEYTQNDTKDFSNPEDVGRQLAPPHSSNNNAQFVDAVPAFNPGPQYAEVAPAIGAQYNANDYESPVLEDDSVSEYSETGFNSNFMR